ncbi:MAG TPA: DUF4097 family beta strand repeat-containing protein [Puia sp.]|nr:DUF4097 family beta strand repeat-containing protein [Puia sp.]
MQKISFLLLACGLQVFSANAQNSGHTPPFLVKSLSGASVRQVNVETTGGNISVTGSADADARVEVYIWGNNGNEDLSKAEIQKRLDELYELNITVSNNKLTAIAKPKEKSMNWKKGLSISFKVFAPQGSSTTLRTSGGNIRLKDLSGGIQDFKTSGGNLDIDQLSGKITGRTSGGNIIVADSKEDIDLSTSGGNIEASNCNGNIRLSTSGGNLRLRLLQGSIRSSTSGGNVEGEEVKGELSAHTSGGNVRLRDLYCSLETSTSGGHIEVNMKELGKYLTVTNSSGDIDLELPQNKGIDLRVRGSKVKANSLSNFKGETDEEHIDGAMNGGGVPVKVDAGGGRVRLNFK